MAGGSWATVYAVLLEAIIRSEPYDVDGGFSLLHAMAGKAEVQDVVGLRAANLHHLTAIISDAGEYQRAARGSMVGIASELEMMGRQRA